MRRRGSAAVALAIAGAACGTARPDRQVIFVDGRAVTSVGDSLLAMTRSGLHGFIVRHQLSGALDTLGAGILMSPLHIQEVGERWYVSDVADGRAVIRVFRRSGSLEGEVRIDTIARVPHQFAVLPDERIVVEGAAGRLMAIAPDSVATFATTEGGPKPALLTAAGGGVLYALPDRFIALYNAFGNIRWQIDWPWRETAFVSDIAVDANGRIHLIAGVPSEGKFIVYSLSPVNGEVLRWSVPGPYATFVVDRLGAITPDSAGRWAGGG